MRTELEMMSQILRVIENDSRIMAAYMNGSRCNLNAKKDIFQDYDLVFVVDETKLFYENKAYMNCFGEVLYYQCPEEMDHRLGKVTNLDECYGWLVQYKDGVRIDLHVVTLGYALNHLKQDRLCKLLLDKTGCLPHIPMASELDYFVKCVSEIEFQASTNEFWWCLNNVAKALWRKEELAVLDVLNEQLRPQLLKMLICLAAYPYDFRLNVGKGAKWLSQYCDQGLYSRYLATYTSADLDEMKKAILIMIDLFDEVAQKVSDLLQYQYNQKEASNSRYHLIKVLALKEDACDY